MSSRGNFAALRSGCLSWAVAAIHGEAEKLRSLHRQLAERIQTGDNLIYLGNILGRGAVAETMHEILTFRREIMARPGAESEDIVYLRGSQEEMWHKLLQIQFAPNAREVLDWMEAEGVGPTLAAYGGSIAGGIAAGAKGPVGLAQWTNGLREVIRASDGHDAFMNALHHAAYTEDRTLLFVHAGIDASRPLSQQTDSFWWGGRDFARLDTPYGGFRRVVRGFDRYHPGAEVGPVTATLDGGCGFGGPLIAACFDAAGDLLETLEA